MRINGETTIKGSNWRSGVTYTVVIVNTSGSAHTVYFRSDHDSSLKWAPVHIYNPYAGQTLQIDNNQAMIMYVTSLGTSSAEAMFGYSLNEISPFFNSANIGT